MSGLGRKVKSQSPDNPAMAHDAPEARPDENGEDQPMHGPHNPPPQSLDGWRAEVVAKALSGMAEVPPTLSDAEVMDDSNGSFNNKRKRNVTNTAPDQPSSSEDVYECDDDDDDDKMEARTRWLLEGQIPEGQSVGGYLKGIAEKVRAVRREEGKGSQGSDEVAGNCKGNDKGNYKGTFISKDDDIFYSFSQKRWDNDKQRARALLAYCERTSSDDKCECTDIQKRQMFNEKAKFPGKWIPLRCQGCGKYLPAEFLENVVLVPLLMTDTQVPIVLEADAVEKVLQAEELRVEREITHKVLKNMLIWQEGIDNNGHNHSGKLTRLGEKLDATIKITRDTEVECQTKISKVNNNVLKLDADMNDVKGNQHLLAAQVSSLGNMMARRDERAKEEVDTMMGMILSRFGELEHLIQRIDQRRRDEAHDEALERDEVRPEPVAHMDE